MRMYANRFLTQSRKGAEKRRGLSFLLCGALRLCVSALMAAAALIFSPTAFGQSITATKAYVDKRVGAVATNTLPARFVPQKGFTLKHYNVSERVTIGGPLTITNTVTFSKEAQFNGGIYVKNGRYIDVVQLNAAQGSFEVMDITGTLRMVDPLANILSAAPAADGGFDFVPLGEMVPTHEAVTNAVAFIVTNEVAGGYTEWRVFRNGVDVSDVVAKKPTWSDELDGWDLVGVCVPGDSSLIGSDGSDRDEIRLSWDDMDANGYDVAYVATRERLERNALGLAMAKDLEKLPDHETVTNVARDVVNTIWDSSLGVAWEARMHNGHLYYIAVTNQPPEVK